MPRRKKFTAEQEAHIAACHAQRRAITRKYFGSKSNSLREARRIERSSIPSPRQLAEEFDCSIWTIYDKQSMLFRKAQGI